MPRLKGDFQTIEYEDDMVTRLNDTDHTLVDTARNVAEGLGRRQDFLNMLAGWVRQGVELTTKEKEIAAALFKRIVA